MGGRNTRKYLLSIHSLGGERNLRNNPFIIHKKQNKNTSAVPWRSGASSPSEDCEKEDEEGKEGEGKTRGKGEKGWLLKEASTFFFF